ncbi:hypothetical protein KUCAC02_013926, partial [Chaenocephalus aceratus]
YVCGLLQMFSGPSASCQLLRPQNTHSLLLIKSPVPCPVVVMVLVLVAQCLGPPQEESWPLGRGAAGCGGGM